MTPEPKSTKRAYFSVSHDVKNYDSWKKAFDDHESFRKDAGIDVVYVFRDADNTNHVTVFGEANSQATIDNFVKSPELKKVMENAGVIGKPDIHTYNTTFAYDEIRDPDFIMISHEVKDYDKWKVGYDDHDTVRKQAGIHMSHLFRDTQNKNYVTALGGANSLETLKRFASNPELKKSMQEAGVTGTPEIHIMERTN